MRLLLPLIMSGVTVLTGGLITWQFNVDPKTDQEKQMIEIVENKMEKSPMRYVVIKYGIEWQNGDIAVVSGRTIFNMPVVTAQIDKKSAK